MLKLDIPPLDPSNRISISTCPRNVYDYLRVTAKRLPPWMRRITLDYKMPYGDLHRLKTKPEGKHSFVFISVARAARECLFAYTHERL